MNFKSYGRRMVVFLIAASVTLVAAAGATWAASADDLGPGAERDRVAAAATKAAGGGTATDVERSDDVGESYEVEVRKPDGTEVDVVLDDKLRVLHRENDDADNDDGDDAYDNDDDDGAYDDDDDAVRPDNDDNPNVNRARSADADDRPLTKAEQTKVAAAAVKAVGSGTATDLEASDDLGTAFEAEVRDRNGAEWDVELDANYKVVSKTNDD